MAADLAEKTDRYEELLAEALSAASVADGGATGDGYTATADTAAVGDTAADGERVVDGSSGEDCLEMARSYLEDGRHFRERDDLVNALAAFSYGHGWLDAGARLDALDVPTEGHLFTE